MQRSSELFKAAQNYIPGGVNSPVRAFKAVGGTPIFIKKAKGAYLLDEDNKHYIDYINSWGPMILGHGNELVIQKIKEQLDAGTSFGTPTEIETEIAKLLVNHVPNVDLVRFVNSGTEACMSAIRLARGYTKRSKIIKFAGCYHGHADAFLIQAGSGAATFGSPSSPGVTQGVAQDTILANYNDLESVTEIFNQNKEEIAAVILEPVAGNMGCVPANKEFLQGLRALCTKHQSILVFDEVMTGFRLALGGAQELLNINADLICFGKIIGGGMPVGAFGGKKEIMQHLAPLGSVYQAGTLSGNPVAMTAGYYTLKQLIQNPDIYTQIKQTTKTIETEITRFLTEKSISFTTNRVGSMFSVFFSPTPIVDFATACTANNPTFNQFFHHALQHGVYLPPSSFETWFISKAIGPKEIDITLEMVRKFND